LSPDEIRSFWKGLDDASMLELSRLALKLQLVTAQRKGEIISSEWEELDLANGWWIFMTEDHFCVTNQLRHECRNTSTNHYVTHNIIGFLVIMVTIS
jgi:integrase